MQFIKSVRRANEAASNIVKRFIIDTGDKLLKVQAKTCNFDGEKLNFSTCSSHLVKGQITHTSYRDDNIDYFCT